jgi:cytochrome c biogenesis protein CcdA/thiol-disulfide isomerase/thioredoxin
MFLLIGAFIAGILTVLAPCVLPLLPVIIGGSISGDNRDKRRPFLIAGSLGISLILFTVLLKATTLLINIPPEAITYFSGSIIILLGLATLFPQVYTTIIARLGIEHRAQKLLGSGTSNRSQWLGPIITGAALGPVFSSCSPVYGYLIATVLPAHFAVAMGYIIAYVLGLALIMLAIGYYGQRLTSRMKFASNPSGYFQRGLAILFILVGILIFTGGDQKLKVFVADHTPFKFDALSAKLIPNTGQKTLDDSQLYNVTSYPEPEITGIQSWINSKPLTLAELKGKVVLIDFWTYSCINCIRSLPHIQALYSQYQKDGLVVIGVHAPEFAFEKVPANVAAAVKDDKLTYPIALDNDLATWDAFHNQYWPAEYLIDRDGNIRRQHFGEGKYDETEKAVRGLLAQGGKLGSGKLGNNLVNSPDGSPPVDAKQTPETYLGTARASTYNGSPVLGSRIAQSYNFAPRLQQNEWTLSGDWQVSDDKITAGNNAKLRINVAAKNVYLVAGSVDPSAVTVSFNGKPISESGGAGSDITDNTLTVQLSKLYRVASFKNFTTGELELSVPSGTDLNTFTFGN